jgi:hypothetical protein
MVVITGNILRNYRGIVQMREKNKKYRGIPLYYGVCVLCILVFCILPVQADYWAGFGENGQYQVTLTNNADGGSSIQGAAVGPGGSIEQLNCPTNSGDSYGTPEETTGVTQNLIIEGPYGWAEVIAKDANENEAHAEVEFTDGCVVVFQHAGPTAPFLSPDSYGIDGQSNGVVAGQCVWSHNFSTIEATSYSFNADGSAAAVSAAATSSNGQPAGYKESGGYCSPLFFVHQGTGAFTPEVDRIGEANEYSGGSFGYIGSPTYAYECGWIKRADTAVVIANSSIPQGFTSLVSGTVEDGNMDFHLGASAGPSYCGNSYKTTACGEVEAKADYGTANAISTGPNGQFANVIASFEQDYCTRNYMDFDLSASGKIYPDGYYKIKAENEIYRPCGYSGVVNATNSAPKTDGVYFFHGEHDYGGVAGLTSTGGSWAHTWPNSPSPP